jgi:hypothetical protein
MPPLERRAGVDVWAAADLAPAAFARDYGAPGIPVLLAGATAGWRGAAEWVLPGGGVDAAALARAFGAARAPVAGGGAPVESVAEYCAWWARERGAPGAPRRYLKDLHLDAHAAGAGAYACPPAFEDDWLGEWLRARAAAATEEGGGGSLPAELADYRFLYLGPAGSATPPHADVLRSHSWSASLAGRKRWRLLPPARAALAASRAGGSPPPSFDHGAACPGASAADAAAAAAEFPGLAEARRHLIEVIQRPGEALFVPSGWLHSVDNLDDCLSINCNWLNSWALPAALAHLRAERAAAAAAIDDCRALVARAAEFEALVERNAAANAGVSSREFCAMLRFVVGGAAAAARGGDAKLPPAAAAARLRAARAALAELAREQAEVAAACGAAEGGGAPSAELAALRAEAAANAAAVAQADAALRRCES